MKLSEIQFEAAAYIFEESNGNPHSDFEDKVIKNSGLTHITAKQIEELIVAGLNANSYDLESERISAYWALSKICNKKRIPEFKKWLAFELDKHCNNAVYQLLIALDRVDEPVFHRKRTGNAFYEYELNISDAKNYLKRNNS